MADAIKNTELDLGEQTEPEDEEVESREDKVKRLKAEIADLKKDGLTDAEIQEIAGDISAAGDSTSGEKEAESAAEDIAEQIEEEYDIVLSDSEIDRLAQRIIELQGESDGGKPVTKERVPKAAIPKPDSDPKRTHFTERRLWGGSSS